MKLLIVEDQIQAAQSLKRGLAEHGFTADLAHDGEEGLHLALGGGYACLVLDVMLPKKDGFAMLTELRAAGVSTPVLFLTARDAVADRVRGLEGGGNDYLVKPFAFSELVARLRNILRQDTEGRPRLHIVGDLTLDPIRRRVQRAGERLDLSVQEYALLELLARNAGQPVTRTRILEEVWDIAFEGDSNVVDVAIRRLRRKVDDPFEQKLIHTLRGVGYVLDAAHG